jgi:DNA-binding GntR family transcriptional regulator
MGNKMNASSGAKAEKVSKFKSEASEQDIVDRIYTAVMERRLSPNTKLSETKLCDSFGVGRMRVRRALLILASQGIVNLQSNRGAYVSCPDQSEANDVFEARMHIEPSLVAQIARGIDPENLKTLQDHIALEDNARAQKDRTSIIRLSGEFHVKLAAASGNMVLRRVIRELVTRTSLIVGLFGSPQNASCPDNEHADITKAIESGNEELAERLLRSHLEHIQSGLDFSMTRPGQMDLKQILGLS